MSSIPINQMPDKSLGKALRYQFSKILQVAKDTISVSDAVEALGINNAQAAKILFKLYDQGWLLRVGKGVYVRVALEFERDKYVIETPWAVANDLFSPCYIGGFTALNDWDLTEQIFLTTVVMTTKIVPRRDIEINGIRYQLYTIHPRKMFGTKTVWEGRTKIQMSDPSRTIIDIFDNPSIGGGIKQVEEFYQNYLKSEHKDIKKLIEYGKQFANGAVFKRLGFLTELIAPKETQLINACKENMTTGNAKLSSSLPLDNLIKRWNLWVPCHWKERYQNK